MEQKYTDEQIKQMLDIKDFRSISADKIRDFFSLIPNMEKEVAIKCIEQFPNFTEYAGEIVSHFYTLCDRAISSDAESSIAAYKKILDNLGVMLDYDTLNEEDRHYIIEKMVEIGDRIAGEEDKKRSFKEVVLNNAGKVALAAMVVASSMLGLRVVNDKNF